MLRLFLSLAVVPVLLLSAASVRAELPTLIPRKVLFGNPSKTSPQISPDGKHLAYLAPDDKNVLQVFVQTLGMDDARKVTNDKKRGIRIYLWTYAPGILLYAQDNDGDENFHIYSVDLKNEKTTDLTPFPKVRATPIHLDRHYPNDMLAILNKENPRLFDVYRIDLTTGELKLDTKNPGDVVGWDVDPKFRVRAAQAMTKDGGMEIRVRTDENSPWKVAIKWGPDDVDGRIIDFTADGKSLWLTSSEGRDTLSLVKRDLETGKDELIAADPGVDAGSTLVNPNTHEVEAVSFNRERIKWKGLNPKITEDLENLEKSGRGEPSVVSTDREWQTWVVAYTSDLHATEYYLYDRATKKQTRLFSSRPELEQGF